MLSLLRTKYTQEINITNYCGITNMQKVDIRTITGFCILLSMVEVHRMNLRENKWRMGKIFILLVMHKILLIGYSSA